MDIEHKDTIDNIELWFDIDSERSRITKDAGARAITKDLLSSLFHKIIIHSREYYQQTEEHLFAWGENQLKTARAQVHNQVSDAHEHFEMLLSLVYGYMILIIFENIYFRLVSNEFSQSQCKAY